MGMWGASGDPALPCVLQHTYTTCATLIKSSDSALNSDICTMLIDDSSISMRASLLLLLLVQEKKKKSQRALKFHTSAHALVHVARCDPERCALASGCLEVSGDAVSACGSGCIGLGLMETCSNFPGSFAVGGKSFCALATFSQGTVGGMFPFLESEHGCFYNQTCSG